MARRYALSASDIEKLLEGAANKKVHFDTYYKDQDRPMHSGRPLPKDDDGVVRDVVFINCDFHWNCEDVASTYGSREGKIIYENCTFLDCDRPWHRGQDALTDKIVMVELHDSH